jgi:HEPN domain-containing protein
VAEAGADLWWIQADADCNAARRVFDPADDRTFCQAVAKQQQAVEKAIKALAAAVRDARMASIRIKFTHGLENLINALLRLHRPTTDNASIQGRIDRLLSMHYRSEIAALMEFAPHAPLADEPVARNTEYPYQTGAHAWRAPAQKGSFKVRDVTRFQSLADYILRGTEHLIAAVARRP